MFSAYKQAGFAHIFLILFLLAGLGVALFFIGNPTNLFPRAYNTQPVDYTQRREVLKNTFKLPSGITDEEIENEVKNDLLKADVKVEGHIIEGNADIAVIGECLYNQTDYLLSEYGVFPPICLSSDEKEKLIEFTIAGAETTADFIIPYAQAKKAVELGPDIQQVRDLLKVSGIADRIQTSSISGPNSGFDGYAVTLIRIKELEQDVQQNPDGSGNLTPEQEEARRGYLKGLRDIWEKQHNLSIELAGAAAGALIDRPLRLVGSIAEPITLPLVQRINNATEPAKSAIFDYLENAWQKLTGKKAEIIEDISESHPGTGGSKGSSSLPDDAVSLIRHQELDTIIGNIEKRLKRKLDLWEVSLLEHAVQEQKKTEQYFEVFAKQVDGKYISPNISDIEEGILQYFKEIREITPRNFRVDGNGIYSRVSVADDTRNIPVVYPGFIVYRIGSSGLGETVRLYRGVSRVKPEDRQLAPILRTFKRTSDGELVYGENTGVQMDDIKGFIDGDITLDELIGKSSYATTIFQNHASMIRHYGEIVEKIRHEVRGNSRPLSDLESMVFAHIDYHRDVIYPSVFVSSTKNPLFANNKFGSMTTEGGVLVLDVPVGETLNVEDFLFMRNLQSVTTFSESEEVYIIGEIKQEWIKGFIPALASRTDEFLEVLEKLNDY